MKQLMLVLIALVIALPVSAQEPETKLIVKPGLTSFVGYPPADSARIRSLEARADSLTDRVAQLEAGMRALSEGMRRVTGDPGKGDNTSTDLWTMLGKLVDRVCRGDRTNCP